MTQLAPWIDDGPVSFAAVAETMVSPVDDRAPASSQKIPAPLLQLLFDSLQVGLAIVDEQGTLVGHNAAWNSFLVSGLPQSAALARGSNVIEACWNASGFAPFEPQGIARGLEAILRRAVPEFRIEYSVGAGLLGATLEIRGFACQQESNFWVLLTHEDITVRKKAERAAVEAAERLQLANQELETLNGRLERLASVDELTSLLNRRSFERILAAAWEAAHREGGPMALALFDVDCFKEYNDSCGHPAGDACLQSIARALARAIAGTELTAARYGGEEFAVILPGFDLDQTWAFAQGFRREIDALALRHPGSTVAPHITISGGCGARISSADSVREILYRTDTALYAAKRGGRNRICRQPQGTADASPGDELPAADMRTRSPVRPAR